MPESNPYLGAHWLYVTEQLNHFCFSVASSIEWEYSLYLTNSCGNPYIKWEENLKIISHLLHSYTFYPIIIFNNNNNSILLLILLLSYYDPIIMFHFSVPKLYIWSREDRPDFFNLLHLSFLSFSYSIIGNSAFTWEQTHHIQLFGLNEIAAFALS